MFNKIRTATIVCKEETHFVTLSREVFNRLLGNIYLLKLQFL